MNEYNRYYNNMLSCPHLINAKLKGGDPCEIDSWWGREVLECVVGGYVIHNSATSYHNDPYTSLQHIL